MTNRDFQNVIEVMFASKIHPEAVREVCGKLVEIDREERMERAIVQVNHRAHHLNENVEDFIANQAMPARQGVSVNGIVNL